MMKNRFNFYLLCIENIKEISLFSNQFDSVMMLKLFKTAFSFISLIEDEFLFAWHLLIRLQPIKE